MPGGYGTRKLAFRAPDAMIVPFSPPTSGPQASARRGPWPAGQPLQSNLGRNAGTRNSTRAVPLELEEKPIKGAAPRHARLLQTSPGVRAARSRHRLAMRVLLQGRERTASRRGGDSTVADRLAREL